MNKASLREIDFEKLFKKVLPEDITDNVFTLTGRDFYIITAGNETNYNSMIASGGGLGFHLKRPTTWCNIRADRYTLEIIEKEKTYTLAYLPNEYKKQMLILAKETGRNSNKMKEVELTSIKTPSGNISFKEARLIFECKLTESTTATSDDFYTQEAKDFINKAYKEDNYYRKLVFGEITSVWVKK